MASAALTHRTLCSTAERPVTKSDAQLIREARTDPEAFAELYRRHAGAIAERALAEQIRTVLTRAVAALPAAQRDAVRLDVVDELAYATVASRRGCSELAARLRVMRGLNELARAIDQGGGDG